MKKVSSSSTLLFIRYFFTTYPPTACVAKIITIGALGTRHWYSLLLLSSGRTTAWENLDLNLKTTCFYEYSFDILQQLLEK
jgi:hypothetical protein